MTSDDAASRWSLDGADGDLLVQTGVAGPAAPLGHRLTLVMREWRATARWQGSRPVAAELTVETRSLQVVRGEGGVTPLSAPEKVLVRRNALGALDAKRYPRITFQANSIEQTNDGYRLVGPLTIHGTTRLQTVELRVDEQGANWWLSSETSIRQPDFGVRPYSQFLGALRVADDVTVAFTAKRAKG